ncbi:hypothetical protein ACP6C7_04100 [Mycolicibacterium septicum]|uniref:Secreted protein n=1 Tax=Mycolicibacterium septicum TaxID=98668 RepID=A0ABW9LSF5_9MYCO
MLAHLGFGGRFVVSGRVVIDQVVIVELVAVELVHIRVHLPLRGLVGLEPSAHAVVEHDSHPITNASRDAATLAADFVAELLPVPIRCPTH